MGATQVALLPLVIAPTDGLGLKFLPVSSGSGATLFLAKNQKNNAVRITITITTKAFFITRVF